MILLRKVVSIQKLKKSFKVHGLEQIPKDVEIINAKLLRKASDFYLYVTCFFPSIPTEKMGREVGIDFRIEYNLTLSNGQTFDIYVPETKGVKLASKR